MLSIIAKKKEIRLRKAILRAVFEENLFIAGKLKRSAIGRRPFYSSKTVLTLSVLFIAIFLFGTSLTPSFFSEEKEITAGEISGQNIFEPVESSAASVDYMSLLGNPGVPLSRMFGLGVRTILIDPGHGGEDPGTIGKMGTMEKDITLDIAKRLKKRLEKDGRFNVVMTRDSDITVPLNQRVEIARLTKADIFISIHINYLPFRPINIIETYYFGPSTDDSTYRLAEQENADSRYGLSDFREIIGRLGETLKLQESSELAGSIQHKLFVNTRKHNGNIYDFGVKRAPFVVLLGVDVPAVLTEVSCLSNIKEEKQLNRPGHRESIARYLEMGIRDYLNNGEFSKGDTIYEAKRITERR